jgi:hypothetical protein
VVTTLEPKWRKRTVELWHVNRGKSISPLTLVLFTIQHSLAKSSSATLPRLDLTPSGVEGKRIGHFCLFQLPNPNLNPEWRKKINLSFAHFSPIPLWREADLDTRRNFVGKKGNFWNTMLSPRHYYMYVERIKDKILTQCLKTIAFMSLSQNKPEFTFSIPCFYFLTLVDISDNWTLNSDYGLRLRIELLIV